MATENASPEEEKQSGGLTGIQVVWIILATILVTVVLTFWVVRTYIYAQDFKPVELGRQETQKLNSKLRMLGYDPAPATPAANENETDQRWLRPERYDEAHGKRELFFTERELNGLLANNKDLAKKLAVDLSDNMVSARLLVPVDPDFPFLGGKTLRVSAGVEASFQSGRPIIKLRGVSVMGVPIPNAWLGGLKNVDLIGEFGDAGGFWQAFSQGVQDIQVEDGKLKISLKE
ncbi:MAG TPA: arginine N-succinyltransferase [Thiolapillus brandeum]|uniref:Arginine N-succinyltransferase n=1 Tax=Thiolapillus brandeum TaxID=1076588 RepID=A0A831KBX5_9GAMM|nr:arginine N-succinyltransferase [Thiolapillus brandeum]